jgi:ferredoxin-NADP reductase
VKTITQQIDSFFSLTNLNSSINAYFEPIIQLFKANYRADTYAAKVVGLTHISVNTFTLTLKPSPAWGLFKAGDHVPVHIVKNGAYVTRYFTIASSPQYFKQTGLIELCIRSKGPEHAQTSITQFMKDTIQASTSINLSKAAGEFHLHSNTQEKTLMIAGGSGITPFRAMLQQLSLRSEYRANITLLYYARKEEEFLFAQELKDMGAQGILDVHFINSQSQGHFGEAHIKAYCPDVENRQAYICGPGSMIETAKEVLLLQGVPLGNLHDESFGPSLSANNQQQTGEHSFVAQFKSLAENVIAPSNKSLLHLAQESGLNPTFGCGIGVCHQCICQKQSGQVRNIKTGKLSDQGPEEIQLCISQPHSNVVLDL